MSYAYNHNGIRTSKTESGITTDFIVDENRDYAQVLQEIQSGAVVVDYTYGHDLISQERGGVDSYFVYDGLGSTRALTNDAGIVTDIYNYAAFGEPLDILGFTNASENSYLYTGEQHDSESGNYYLRARYMDPGLGRMLSMDTWAGKDCTPITQNKYVYGYSDPTYFVDPSGNIGIVGVMAGRFVNVSSTTVMYGYRAASTANKARKTYNAIVGSLCKSGKSIHKYFRKGRKGEQGHHSWPKYLGGDPKQELVDVAAILHTRLHSLIRYIHRLNGLKINNTADYAALSNYQKAKSLVLLIKTTEAFDAACIGVRGYKPIAPTLKKLLGR